MKQIVILVSLIALGLSTLNAQTLKRGDFDFAAGLGLVPTFAADNARASVLPLSLRASYRLANNFSLGAYAGFSSSEADKINLPDGRANQVTNDTYILGLRAAAHTYRYEKWDLYGGFLVGYNISDVAQSAYAPAIDDEKTERPLPTFSRPAENQFTFSGFIGASYFPGKRVGVFSEVGFGISLVNLGVQFKL